MLAVIWEAEVGTVDARIVAPSAAKPNFMSPYLSIHPRSVDSVFGGTIQLGDRAELRGALPEERPRRVEKSQPEASYDKDAFKN
jgi:hypothetical protein